MYIIFVPAVVSLSFTDAKAAEAAQSAYYDPNRPQTAYVPPPYNVSTQVIIKSSGVTIFHVNYIVLFKACCIHSSHVTPQEIYYGGLHVLPNVESWAKHAKLARFLRYIGAM